MPTHEFTATEGPYWSKPIRDLGLKIEGTQLEPILHEFLTELDRVGIRRLRPHFYLSHEWGVPFNTTAIAIPFYLARPELTALHARHVGHIEGSSRADILRYLRHEMGHVVNYGYRLYEQEEWVKLFGSITQPYLEDYRPEPFNPRYVAHLPGWYAQKHPDEDWAETFAVWMTPGRDWRTEYADKPEALAKLHYCDRIMAELADREPVVTTVDLDEAVDSLDYSLRDYYRSSSAAGDSLPPGLDGSLRSIFEELGQSEDPTTTALRRPAAELIRKVERDLMAHVYRWTGHFPERTRALLRHLAERADQLKQVYPEDRETPAVVALTTLVTALAMNYVHRGSYAPQ
ncbi:MAG TPA: putative zinc-binding metallopeptidase [Gemmataceae bacterium]|nr:putative zinc-binding metallopeptidase [Gemmataceae bacterium]